MAAIMARLWNDNEHPFETVFKGDKVRIDPGKYVEGDLYEMNDLKGQYHPVVWQDEVAKIQDPKSYKKLRLERLSDKPPVEAGHKCMKCKLTLPSEKTLAVHLEEAHAAAAKVENLDDVPQATRTESFKQNKPSSDKSGARPHG